MFKIDLNCDMGESFGAWQMGQDEAILPYITSANIACGYHAGDASTMRKTVANALKHNVALGAHPGLPDLQGFGRRNIDISAQEAYDIVVAQVGALVGVATSQGAKLHHVKAHGALYNMASANYELSKAIAQAVYDIDPSLILYALAGGELVKAGNNVGLTVAQEVFADRTYQNNGLLTSRKQENAMITDTDTAISQVVQMIKQGTVTAVTGESVAVQADTLCIHGDQPNALAFAKALRLAFKQEEITVQTV